MEVVQRPARTPDSLPFDGDVPPVIQHDSMLSMLLFLRQDWSLSVTAEQACQLAQAFTLDSPDDGQWLAEWRRAWERVDAMHDVLLQGGDARDIPGVLHPDWFTAARYTARDYAEWLAGIELVSVDLPSGAAPVAHEAVARGLCAVYVVPLEGPRHFGTAHALCVSTAVATSPEAMAGALASF